MSVLLINFCALEVIHVYFCDLSFFNAYFCDRVFRPNHTCKDSPLFKKKCFNFRFMYSVIFHNNATTCNEHQGLGKWGCVEFISFFSLITYQIHSINRIYENDNGFSRGSDHIITRVQAKCQLVAVLYYLYC